MPSASFVPPASAFERHWARFPVIGLAYVAARLEEAGHEVVLLDGKLNGLSDTEIIEGVRRAEPHLAGFTCMTVEFPAVCRVAGAVRQVSKAPIVVGGAHVNAVGAACLDDCPDLDPACCGEGEELILELVDALAAGGEGLDEIAGLAHRRSGAVVANPKRPYPRDYDAFPFPAWHHSGSATRSRC